MSSIKVLDLKSTEVPKQDLKDEALVWAAEGITMQVIRSPS